MIAVRAGGTIALLALLLAGCASEPAGSVAAPTASELATGIDRALDSLEKTPPQDRMAAHASLDDLLKEKGTPAQKERFAKLMAP